jgi:hypothetical protein
LQCTRCLPKPEGSNQAVFTNAVDYIYRLQGEQLTPEPKK